MSSSVFLVISLITHLRSARLRTKLWRKFEVMSTCIKRKIMPLTSANWECKNFCISALQIDSWSCLLLTYISTLKILTNDLFRVWTHSVNSSTLWLQLVIFFPYSKKCWHLTDTFKLLINHSCNNHKFYIQTVKVAHFIDLFSG